MATPIEKRTADLTVLEGREKTHLLMHEIYLSVQGESTHAGRRCVFVRTSVCNLRCGYCDTAHAFAGGEVMLIDDVISKIESLGCKLVEITGGEPLLQAGVIELSKQLLDRGFEVLVETGGSLDISVLPDGVKRILDIKTPGSGEVGANLLENLKQLREGDELKFVVTCRADFDWSVEFLTQHEISELIPKLISPCQPQVKPAECVNWVKKCAIDVRVNLQLHKFIWPVSARGV
ncbi:radical SAM protein [Planctomycetota bacterium]|nr:radical SAM protein [Planctomycetota bacterium]